MLLISYVSQFDWFKDVILGKVNNSPTLRESLICKFHYSDKPINSSAFQKTRFSWLGVVLSREITQIKRVFYFENDLRTSQMWYYFLNTRNRLSNHGG